MPPAAALESTFSMDNSAFKVTNFVDTVCFGAGGQPPCSDVSVPPNLLFPTGHSVVIVPENLAMWADGGSIFLFNLNDPTVVLTQAEAAAGASNESLVLKVEITLQKDISETEPAYLWVGDISGATVDVQELEGQLLQGIVVLSEKP